MSWTRAFDQRPSRRRLGAAPSLLSLLVCLILASSPVIASEAETNAPPAASDVFASLAKLEGEWQATIGPEGSDEKQQSAHLFRNASNGTVVMETMWPGGDHEMINMYHMDGDALVLTHYCAGGNQPRMKYDPAKSEAGRLFFAFDGGTNLDPEKDGHIHSAEIQLGEDGVISHWHGYYEGKRAGTQIFELTRTQ